MKENRKTNRSQFLKHVEEISRLEGIRMSEAMNMFIDIAFLTLRSRLLLGDVFAANEAKYMDWVAKLQAPHETLKTIAKMMAIAFIELSTVEKDFLGPIYMEIGSNEHMGQFFTPSEVSELMAMVTIPDIKELLDRKPVVSVSEPTCGFGGIVLSVSKHLREMGVDVPRRVHFHMIDLDHRCVKASFIQCSIADISATIVHGDTIRLDEFAAYYTPASLAFPKDVAGAPRFSVKPIKEEAHAN